MKTSSNPSLHFDPINICSEYSISDDFIIEVLNELPEKWIQYPYSSSTTTVFTNLAKQNNFFALKVPSSIVGLEYNIILNPLYKAFGNVEIKDFIKLPLDARLKASRYG